MAGHLTIPSARRTYGLVVVVIIGLLLAGLLIPLIFGERGSGVVLSGSDGSGPSPTETSDLAQADDGSAIEDEGAPDVAESSATPLDGAEAPAAALESPAAGTSPGSSEAEPPSGAPEEAGAPPDGGTAPADAPLTASDVGVTASTIKVGVVYLDLSAVAPLGLSIDNFDVETQKRSFQVYFDEINEAGGINGRRVEAVYVRNDPLDTGAARSRCVRLAKDEQVFAVLGWVTEEAGCLAQEFQIPTFAYRNYLRASYVESDNYLISSLPSLERTAMNWAGAMDQLGALQGRTLGSVASETPEESAAANALESTLGQLGHQITYRARLSANENTANSQLPIEVQRMRRAGVDTVLLPTNFVLARMWVENAESQGWVPQYHVSDIGQLATDDLVDRMPPSFDGAVAITNNHRSHRAGEPEPDPERSCREIYNRRAEGSVEYGEVHPVSNSCPLARIFEAGVRKAGSDLTRAGTVASVQTLGRLPLATYAGGSFKPGKTDYNDDVRPTRWQAECRCYEVTGPVIPGRF